MTTRKKNSKPDGKKNNPKVNTQIGGGGYFDELSGVINDSNMMTLLSEEITESQTLYQNAKYYYSVNEYSGALVSYACASVLLNTIIRRLEGYKTQSSSSDSSITILDKGITKASHILDCCLEAVEELQKKVSTVPGGKNDEKREKWSSRCVKIQPLVVTSKNCIFYKDVIGLEKEKSQLNAAFISPLIYSNLFPKTSKGILMYGPPGTGKTLLIKAAVNELQSKNTNIGVLYFAPSPADLKGKYVGETEKKIEEWFTCASYAACQNEKNKDECGDKKYISIIFIDEIDSIAGDRANDPSGLNANSVNTLLQMMDGISSKPNVSVIGVTNYPWSLDSAVIRRFDTQILVGLPTVDDIKKLLDYEINNSISMTGKDSDFCGKYNFDNDNNDSNITKAEACGQVCTPNFDSARRFINEPFWQQFFIEYYEDQKNIDYSNLNSLSQVQGIITKLLDNQYTNSDIARFVRTAIRHTGELCVDANLFYDTGILGNSSDEKKYMSCITKIKDEAKAIEWSIKILKSLITNNSNTNDALPQIYHNKPPDISVIEYNGYYYYNVKCILHKDAMLLLSHRLLTGVYIKGNKVDNGKDFTPEDYKSSFLRDKGEYAKLFAGESTKASFMGLNENSTATTSFSPTSLGLGAAAGIATLGVLAAALPFVATGAAAATAATAATIGYGSAITGLVGIGGIVGGISATVGKGAYVPQLQTWLNDFLSDKLDDFYKGADTDVIMSYNLSFERTTTSSTVDVGAMISKTNVMCFFTEIMNIYESVYGIVEDQYIKTTPDGDPLNNLSDTTNEQKGEAIKKNTSIFKIQDKFISDYKDVNLFDNNNNVTKQIFKIFESKSQDFINCFRKIEDFGRYYDYYSYLLLYKLLSSPPISSPPISSFLYDVYISDNIIQFVEDKEISLYSESNNYEINNSEEIVTILSKQTQENNLENEILIQVHDYIKLIEHFDIYETIVSPKNPLKSYKNENEGKKYIKIQVKYFTLLFKRNKLSKLPNNYLIGDAKDKIEKRDDPNANANFHFCLIQIYMNGAFNQVNTYITLDRKSIAGALLSILIKEANKFIENLKKTGQALDYSPLLNLLLLEYNYSEYGYMLETKTEFTALDKTLINVAQYKKNAFYINNSVKGTTQVQLDMVDYETLIKKQLQFEDFNSTSSEKSKKIILYYKSQKIINKDEGVPTGDIRTKQIFIPTTFNFLRLQTLVKSNIFTNVFNFVAGTKDYLKSWFISTATLNDKAAKEAARQELMAQLVEKNKILAVLFKNVKTYGFLNSNTSSIVNDDIKTSDIINWTTSNIVHPIANTTNTVIQNLSKTVGSTVESIPFQTNMGSNINSLAILDDAFNVLASDTQESLLSSFSLNLVGGTLGFVYNKIYDLYTSLNKLDANTLSEGAAEVSPSILDGIYSNISGLFGTISGRKALLGLRIISELKTFISRNNVTNEDIINNLYFNTLFNIITTDGKIPVKNFEKTPNEAVNDQIYSIQNNFFLSVNLGTYFDGLKNILTKYFSKISTQNNQIHKFKSLAQNINPNSLYNLNTPLASFYYAFNEVKTTYDSTLGNDLKEYAENKDAFLAKKKKEREGKK